MCCRHLEGEYTGKLTHTCISWVCVRLRFAAGEYGGTPPTMPHPSQDAPTSIDLEKLKFASSSFSSGFLPFLVHSVPLSGIILLAGSMDLLLEPLLLLWVLVSFWFYYLLLKEVFGVKSFFVFLLYPKQFNTTFIHQ